MDARIVLGALALVAACGMRSRVDLNAASPAELADLPGLTAADAARLVANRPYYDPQEVVARGIIDRGRWDQLADRIMLGPPAMPEYLRWTPPQAEGP
jgi:hypothetical protein